MAVTPNEETNETLDWVKDLFRPNFQANDLLITESPTADKYADKFKLARDFYSSIYSKVILEEKNKSQCPLTAKNDSPDKLKPESISVDTNSAVVFNSDDFNLLFSSHEKLKHSAKKLLLIINSRNEKLSSLKGKNRKYEKMITEYKNKVDILYKEKATLKSNVKTNERISQGLEEKLRFYEKSNTLLANRIYTAEKENCELRSKLEKQSLLLNEKDQQLTNLKSTYEHSIKTQEAVIQHRFEQQIKHNEDEISDLASQLGIKKDEFDRQRVSLITLQRHMLALSKEETVTKLESHVLEVRPTQSYLKITDI